MAEKEKQDKKAKADAIKQKIQERSKEQEESEILVRIFGYDIPGSKNIIVGLTRIKGISWAISNAVCRILKYENSKVISELTKADIEKIEKALKDLKVPAFLKNRRHDLETGESRHFYGSDLDMKKEFDIKRLREIRSYRGIRHALKLPVRGQRTRSHFRKKSQASGMKKKNEAKT